MVPLSEYPGHSYEPECEYVEGVFRDRKAGEIPHGDAMSRISVEARIRGFWSGVAVRTHVTPTRIRVPDVTIVGGGKPAGRFISAPSEIALEILSPHNRAPDIQDKMEDYLAFGVSCVWVVDPETRRAWWYTSSGARERRDGFLRNPAGDLAIPLTTIFKDGCR